jgi:acetyl esterase/lipase
MIKKISISFSFMVVMACHLMAQEKIYLYPSDTDTAQGYLLVYKAERNAQSIPDAMLVIPGGGYSQVAMNHEGMDVAKWMNSMGLDAYVLRYRVNSAKGEHHYPDQLNDVKEAIKIVRKTKYKNVGVMGFSAGGHLAGTYLTEKKHRASFGILIYPVITADSAFRHKGSFINLLGKEAGTNPSSSFSIDKRVTKKTPPLWLLHTRDDKTVPYQNSTLLYDAARLYEPKTQLTLFDKGGHGFGMRTLPNETEQWKGLCATWIKDMCSE